MKRFARIVLPVGLAVLALASEPSAAAKHPTRPTPSLPNPAPPSSTQVHAIRQNNIGIALMERQRFEDALGKFQTACIMDPNSEIGCLNMGIAFLNMQRYDDARRVLSKSASKLPQSPVPWFNLGLIDKTVGQANAALKDFEKAASSRSERRRHSIFSGRAVCQRAAICKSGHGIQKAVELNPFHASAELGLAEVAQQTNDTDAALAHLNRFRHITSDNLGEPISVSLWPAGKIFPRAGVALDAGASRASDSGHISRMLRLPAGLALPAGTGVARRNRKKTDQTNAA